MYHHTKNQVSMSRDSKVTAQTDRQTDKQYENITFPHTRVVKGGGGVCHKKGVCLTSAEYGIILFEVCSFQIDLSN